MICVLTTEVTGLLVTEGWCSFSYCVTENTGVTEQGSSAEGKVELESGCVLPKMLNYSFNHSNNERIYDVVYFEIYAPFLSLSSRCFLGLSIKFRKKNTMTVKK